MTMMVWQLMESRYTLFVVAAVVIAMGAGAGRFRRRTPEIHKRGAVILEKTRRRRTHVGGLMLAGLAIPLLDETKHFKMVGTTGTGKSTAIRELLGGALARGDRAIFADPDGGYRERFFCRQRGDVVLNPFEPLSVTWDPFAEIVDPYDVDQLSAGLIPATEQREQAEQAVAAAAELVHQGVDLTAFVAAAKSEVQAGEETAK